MKVLKKVVAAVVVYPVYGVIVAQAQGAKLIKWSAETLDPTLKNTSY